MADKTLLNIYTDPRSKYYGKVREFKPMVVRPLVKKCVKQVEPVNAPEAKQQAETQKIDKPTSTLNSLPLFYGKALLPINFIWQSDELAFEPDSAPYEYKLYHVLAAVAADVYRTVVFGPAIDAAAYVKTLGASQFSPVDTVSGLGGLRGRLKALLHWFQSETHYNFPFAEFVDDQAYCCVFAYLGWYYRTLAGSNKTPQVPSQTTQSIHWYDKIGGECLIKLDSLSNQAFFGVKTVTLDAYNKMTLAEKRAVRQQLIDERLQKMGLPELYKFQDTFNHYYADALELLNYPCFWNLGNESDYLAEAGPYASKYPGIMTAAFSICQFKTETATPAGTLSIEKEEGNWYKEILLDLLYRSGVDITTYRKDTFAVPGDIAAKYYLNVSITNQCTIRQAIEEVLDFVGVRMYLEGDTFKLRPDARISVTPLGTISEHEIEYELYEQNKEDIPRFYKGFWTDYDNMKFSGHGEQHDERVECKELRKSVSITNDLGLDQAGVLEKTIDLSCYRDEDTAEARLSEIAKVEGYPKLYGNFIGSLAFFSLMPGDVWTLDLSDSRGFSIDVEISRKIIGKASIKFDFVQINPISAFSSGGSDPGQGYANTDVPIIETLDVVELPQSTRYEKGIAVAFLPYPSGLLQQYLADKPGSYKLTLYRSSTLTGVYTTWIDLGDYDTGALKLMSYGTLTEDLLSTAREKTENTDSTNVIKAALDYFLPSTPTTELLLQIDDEFILAKSWSLVSYIHHFKGYERCQFGTAKQDHTAGATVKVFRRVKYGSLTENWFGMDVSYSEISYTHILELADSTPFFVKPILYNQTFNEITSLALTPAVAVAPSELGKMPLTVGGIKAARSGSNVDIMWRPRSLIRTYDGAGVNQAQDCYYNIPYLYEGAFQYQLNGGGWVDELGYEITVTDAFSFTIEVRHIVDGIEGPGKLVTIGVADGTYEDGILI